MGEGREGFFCRVALVLAVRQRSYQACESIAAQNTDSKIAVGRLRFVALCGSLYYWGIDVIRCARYGSAPSWPAVAPR